MNTIWADWHHVDFHDRIILNLRRSRDDLEKLTDEPFDGMVVTLNIQDEFEIEATLVYDDGWWRDIPNRGRISYPLPNSGSQ